MPGQDHIDFLLLELTKALDKLAEAKNKVIDLRATLRLQIKRSEHRLTDRDKNIYMQYLAGDPVEKIAQEQSLSVSWIKDICKKQEMLLKMKSSES